MLAHDAFDEKKPQIQKMSDDCIGWQNREYSKAAGKEAPDLADTHYIHPVNWLSDSMESPSLQMYLCPPPQHHASAWNRIYSGSL